MLENNYKSILLCFISVIFFASGKTVQHDLHKKIEILRLGSQAFEKEPNFKTRDSYLVSLPHIPYNKHPSLLPKKKLFETHHQQLTRRVWEEIQSLLKSYQNQVLPEKEEEVSTKNNSIYHDMNGFIKQTIKLVSSLYNTSKIDPYELKHNIKKAFRGKKEDFMKIIKNLVKSKGQFGQSQPNEEVESDQTNQFSIEDYLKLNTESENVANDLIDNIMNEDIKSQPVVRMAQNIPADINEDTIWHLNNPPVSGSYFIPKKKYILKF